MATSPLDHLDDEISRLLAEISALASLDELIAAEATLTGRRSVLSTLQKSLGSLEPEERRTAGAQLQAARREVESALEVRRGLLEAQSRAQVLERDRLDLGDVVTEQVPWTTSVGHPGLVALTQRALEDVFVGMGFTVSDGPEVESDWYNFEALNIPPAHPARGLWDTFYVELGEPETVVLRTHTSPTQVHLMETAVATGTLPIHSVMPGRCYRLRGSSSTAGSPSPIWRASSRPSRAPISDRTSRLDCGRDTFLLPNRRPSSRSPARSVGARAVARVPSPAGLNSAAAAWSIPRCSPRSGLTPRSGVASRSVSGSTAAPRCAIS